MLTSIARPLQPPDFQFPQCDSVGTGCNDAPIDIGSPTGFRARSRPSNPPFSKNHHGDRKAFKPAQYAHPLQSVPSRRTELMPFAKGQAEEYMLRRKTPNGTVAAGYDGYQAELTKRPHASKHLVMQADGGQVVDNRPRISRGFGSAGMICPKQPLRQENRSLVGRNDWDQYTATPHKSPTHKLPASSETERGFLDHHDRAIPRIDSILNQSQALPPLFIDGAFQTVPVATQSCWLPSGGPTASDKQGQYGPYCPDGGFIPYCPAAFRDVTKNATNVTTSNTPLNNDRNGAIRPAQFKIHGFHRQTVLDRRAALQSTHSYEKSYTTAQSGPAGQHYPPLDLQGLSLENSQGGNRYWLTERSSFRAIMPQEQSPSQERNPYWQTQSPSAPGMNALQPLYEASPPHLRFKERMLIEAHRAYLNLLASQHQARQQAGTRNLTHDRVSSHVRKQSPTNGKTRSFVAGRPSPTLSAATHPIREARRRAASAIPRHETCPTTSAMKALEVLTQLCQESEWQWIDGILLGGCLAYALANYEKALQWYFRVLACDPNNVEATSNVAATLLSLNRRSEAEQLWLRSVTLRPNYFEAVEHLIGLLSTDQRSKDAVKLIEFVETALKLPSEDFHKRHVSDPNQSQSFSTEYPQSQLDRCQLSESQSVPHYGSSGFAIPNSDNGRMLALIHAKGNMLYGLGDNIGAARAFEDAILIGTGHRMDGIRGLIASILRAFTHDFQSGSPPVVSDLTSQQFILLPPELALRTASIVFVPSGQLPGLYDISHDYAKRAAISTISNSLLSLAKIYQDGISSGTLGSGTKPTPGVHDILALYYLSLSLQPSPSTANNVGILLASVQQVSPHHPLKSASSLQPLITGVAPGSGIALALSYYKYGLELDDRHAHLYTNLGSLLKDIGQLHRAIEMYQKAVSCDGSFDIALANLANAVKDQGRICDAITYYRKAVQANPDFAEAVCGLANALNSVCDWKGRGGVATANVKIDRWHVDQDGMLLDAKRQYTATSGLVGRVVTIVGKQLREGLSWGKGVLRGINLEELLTPKMLYELSQHRVDEQRSPLLAVLESWAYSSWEGAKVVRLVERITKRLCWQLYQERSQSPANYRRRYRRPQLPPTLSIPTAPTVLPFHTFTCPLVAKQIRQISQRNGLRISCSTLRAPWLPREIFPPPAPPSPCLHVGYVSSDFNNHPLAHLMQSVFGLHSVERVKAYCYATTASDSSVHRKQIEREAPVFYDASSWTIEQLVNHIVEDGIHILINLNGYTRGARNEVFAARPAPIQMSFMGFAGTLGAEWCDYLLADTTAVPPQTLRPYRKNVDLIDQIADGNFSDVDDEWVYGENIVFTRETFFCCDHRQSAPDAKEAQLQWPKEQARRWKMRKELFPNLSDDTIILGNFNQLYKIEPTTFRTWLRVLSRLPKAVLWLLRFPDLGESNLRETALQWATPDVASRIIFTDVAPKQHHISRARVCDLFLDTPECNAHTTAADVLWSGTPLLTYPRYEYKMCSRMAASILKGALPKGSEGTEAARDLIVASDDEYEEQAVFLGSSLKYNLACDGQSVTGFGQGRLSELRQLLYESRWTSALFDTRRWVRDLEDAYEIAWRKWVAGEGGDIWLKPT